MNLLPSQIAAIVGAPYIIESPACSSAYAVQGRSPALVAAPATVEELSRVVAAAYVAGMSVVPYGGGTMQEWGRPPAADFLLVQLARLKRVLIYEPDDLTISVEAGLTLDALGETLAANGQMLPLDLPAPASTTVGGALATAMDGPRRLGYGTARDLLIGVQVVEADGRISKAGGMVVKNVSGFDMMKLYTGSLGSLAIIASANFKLIPRPRAAATIACACKSASAAFALARAIHASQLTPVAVEYIAQGEGGRMPDKGLSEALPPLILPASCLLCVRAEGLPAAVERHVRDVAELAERVGASAISVLRDEAHTASWAAINDLARSDDLAADEVLLRLSCLPADLGRALVAANSLATRHGLHLQMVARALSGLAYLRLQGDEPQLRTYYGELLVAWPHLTLLAGPPALKADLPIWGTDLPNLDLMRRIKQEFDPHNRLNSGRYVV
ncbi:MAG: FAD-binding oxidoreductase [Oscillochloris sp.]|nr:FAD-binding oxidoreductase [Oscillochloris sp.]